VYSFLRKVLAPWQKNVSFIFNWRNQSEKTRRNPTYKLDGLIDFLHASLALFRSSWAIFEKIFFVFVNSNVFGIKFNLHDLQQMVGETFA